MARVIVSSGHTQNDPGAVQGELREVDFTRKISNLVVTKLRGEGIVTLSVPPELDLQSKIDWINNTGYTSDQEDICIEFHINQGGQSGLEGWFSTGDEESKRLTQEVISKAVEKTSLSNQGVKEEKEHQLQRLGFLSNTKPTGTLIECLYIDNPSDQAFLKDDKKLDLLAEGIVDGIFEYFDVDRQSQSQATGQTGQQSNQNLNSNNLSGKTSSTFQSPPPFQSANQPIKSIPNVNIRTPINNFRANIPKTNFNSSSQLQSFNQSNQQTMSREERQKMIEDKYQLILGKKVNEKDLNYFVNLGLNEDQMLKRLVESQEHVDMVKNSQEYKKIKPEYEKYKTQIKELTSKVQDKEALIEKQNQLIEQKTRTIQSLQSTTQQDTGNYQHSQQEQMTDIGYSNEQPPQKVSFLDKILRKLNDLLD